MYIPDPTAIRTRIARLASERAPTPRPLSLTPRALRPLHAHTHCITRGNRRSIPSYLLPRTTLRD